MQHINVPLEVVEGPSFGPKKSAHPLKFPPKKHPDESPPAYCERTNRHAKNTMIDNILKIYEKKSIIILKFIFFYIYIYNSSSCASETPQFAISSLTHPIMKPALLATGWSNVSKHY
jgi:hypothetical protein